MKVINKYIRNKKESLNFLLEKPKRRYSPATFHKIRVEIKKLDAIFELINFCEKDFKREKTFEPLKTVFDQAGKVREIQVEHSILKKYFLFNNLKEYKATLQELLSQERKEYFSIVNKKLAKNLKKTFREISPFLSQLNKKKVNTYMKTEWERIVKLLNQKSLQPPQAHELRQELKKFTNNRKSLNLDKRYKPFPKENVLNDLLGKWHDTEVIIINLNKALDKVGPNIKEGNQLEKIISKISAKNAMLFKKINNAIAAP